MAPTIKNLSAFILLTLVALTAVTIAYSGGNKPAPQNRVVRREHSAGVAEQPAAALEDLVVVEGPAAVLEILDVAEEPTAAVPDEPKVAQQGPVLLSPNPPYLNAPIENRLPLLTLDAGEDEPPPNPQQPEETWWRAAEADQLVEEELAEEPVRDEHFTGMGPSPFERPAEEEPTEDVEPAEDEDLASEEEPAEEVQPDQAAGVAAQEEAAETTRPQTSTLPEPEPKPELTPAQAALRDRVRRTLTFHQAQLLSAGENTASEVMHCCLAFGCNTQLYRGGSSGQKVNGITCLCWNYPCAGYELLGLSEGRIAARIGYGLQEHPSELLAVLALARVRPTYDARVGEDVRTVADLVEYEKLSCRSGTDLSLKLIGLAYYLPDQPTWKNSLGEDWSIERIVREELDQPITGAACGGVYRLMGLGYALVRRRKLGQPIEGQFDRARKFVDQYHDYALSIQNSDGSWGPGFLAGGPASRNQAAQLRSTGHVLEWLTMSLPEDRLDDPRVLRSIEYVVRLLDSQRYRRNVRSLSTREIGSVMHALHALVVYDERFLRPRTPKAS